MLQRIRHLHPVVWLLSFVIVHAAGWDWQDAEGYRLAPLRVSPEGKAGFTEIPSSLSGIRFTNLLAEERSLTNQIFLNGSGIAAGDVDGDGLCDLYFCGLDSPNALYRNLGGWRFEDITATAGAACADQASTGAAFADIDGDGDLDLLVNGIGRGTRLFLNDGKGHFTEATAGSGLISGTGSMSLALADVDGDGLLDLYVVNYRTDTMRDMAEFRFRIGSTNGVAALLSINGKPPSAPEFAGRFSLDGSSSVLENGKPDVLYRNLGGGRFEPVSWTNGVFSDEQGKPAGIPYDWGLSAMFHDMNGDGAPDLYVCNDFQSPDRIWINDGHGRFRAIAPNALQHSSLFSMGVDFADIDRDGLDDFFVADMRARDHFQRAVQVLDDRVYTQARRFSPGRPQLSQNTLFLNRGNETYAEIAQLSGVDASDWSWCPVFLDVDLDGYEDLLVSTGHARDLQNADVASEIEQEKQRRPLSPREQVELRRRFAPLKTPNAAFHNRGGLAFEDVSAAWGFDSRRISQGIALADLDNDGSLDVIVNCLNDAPLLYRNNSSRPRLALRLRGKAPNTRGVGARARVMGPGIPAQTAQFQCGGRYLSSDDFIKTFAAGSETNLLTVEITWRDGRQSILRNVPANHIVEVDESASKPPTAKSSVPPQPAFEDISQMLGHEHRDEPFDDFARQPLLPHKLSNLGPGVAWFDFNGDGWEDLFITTGRGGHLGVFRNDGKGHLIRQGSRAFQSASPVDVPSLLGWRPAHNSAELLRTLSTYELPGTNGLRIAELPLNTGRAREIDLLTGSSAGPMAMADIDGDGDLDLFVGGRVAPNRYPEPASSALLNNDNGQLRFDAERSRPFERIGMVAAAVYADLNEDGWPDLILACEAGPLRIFINEQGHLRAWDPSIDMAAPDRTSRQKLSNLTGWWNSIAAGDFDGDGRLDLVAGNWGRNSSRERFLNRPIRLYFGSEPGEPAAQILEAHYDPLLDKYVPAQDWGKLSSVFPGLRERYSNYTAFAAADASQVLAAGLPKMQETEISFQDSVVLLNRDDHFEARPLPIQAQFAPVFGLAVGDLDADGNEDIFLVQNFHGVPDRETPLDAGGALWLRGNGRGDFAPAAESESGISIRGDGRGAALCDFDHDGRLDIVAGENGGLTRLFRNRTANSGLRVHLEGPSGNLQAAGAVARVVFKSGRMGPAHALSIGGGYCSQDSSDMALGIPKEPAQLEIRWPGGKVQRVVIPTISANPGRARAINVKMQ
jgi:hypothetical protein